jgi:hypothetical protein
MSEAVNWPGVWLGVSALTNTGGRMAVRALGSTGCLMVTSSSASFELPEFDRSLLVEVF